MSKLKLKSKEELAKSNQQVKEYYKLGVNRSRFTGISVYDAQSGNRGIKLEFSSKAVLNKEGKPVVLSKAFWMLDKKESFSLVREDSLVYLHEDLFVLGIDISEVTGAEVDLSEVDIVDKVVAFVSEKLKDEKAHTPVVLCCNKNDNGWLEVAYIDAYSEKQFKYREDTFSPVDKSAGNTGKNPHESAESFFDAPMSSDVIDELPF